MGSMTPSTLGDQPEEISQCGELLLGKLHHTPHPSLNQAPVPCSCALYPHRECHRPVELCPALRNSRFLGRQQGRVSNTDLAHRPCLGAAGAVTDTHKHSLHSWGMCALGHRKAPSAASYHFGLGSVLSSRYSWHQAVRTTYLASGMTDLPRPFAPRYLCPQKGWFNVSVSTAINPTMPRRPCSGRIIRWTSCTFQSSG